MEDGREWRRRGFRRLISREEAARERRTAEDGEKKERTSVPRRRFGPAPPAPPARRLGALVEKAMTWRECSETARVQPNGWMKPPR